MISSSISNSFKQLSLSFSFLAISQISLLAEEPSLIKTKFSDYRVTPCPASLCANANGDIYVGVDLNGSLARDPEKGRIVKLRDLDNDGIADTHTVFAELDNVRGLLSFGSKLYVLHTVIPKDTGIATGMHLSVLEDNNGDGIADGPAKRLIKHVSTLKHNQERGADHTTNGIQMGIDGWIYIAIGDYGFVDAEDSDGTKLTTLGGGILRVRPDGTEMELFTHGMRNIYDVAIDPKMNVFTRGNTNDGGGWNVRFVHHIQSGEYGYPMLFKRFTSEVLPALADLGGGSGTGSLYFQEPSWPAKYNNNPWMADWGRSQVFIHRIKENGATFSQKDEPFISCSQVSDLDVDGSGRVYLSAWNGGGFKGNLEKGYIERVVPSEGWVYKPFPKLSELDPKELLDKLFSPDSAKARLAAQQHILESNSSQLASSILTRTKGGKDTIDARVAGLFTYAQLLKQDSIPELSNLIEIPELTEFALKALADRKPWNNKAPIEVFTEALNSNNERVVATALIGLGRIGNKDTIPATLAKAIPPLSNDQEGVLPYQESGAISGKQSFDFKVPFRSYKQIFLISESIDSEEHGHIVWENPRIELNDGTVVKLTEKHFEIKSSKQSKEKTFIGKDCQGKQLEDTLGNPINSGIGSYTDSKICVNIFDKRDIAYFRVTARFTKASDNKGHATFFVSPTSSRGESEGPHTTPNPSIISPHLAVQSLVQMNAVEACLQALNSDSQDGALWALRLMHKPEVTNGLIKAFQETQDEALQNKIYSALTRLYTKEAPYDGSWWWKTKPDTRGPYYVPVQWAESDIIKSFLVQAYNNAPQQQRVRFLSYARLHRTHIEEIDGKEIIKKGASKKGEVGRTSIEDIMLSLENFKGNASKGKGIINQVGCVGCHNTTAEMPVKAPDLTKLGSQTKYEIAESILQPGSSIAPSWISLQLKNGNMAMGTIVSEDDSRITLHDIVGTASTLNVTDIEKRSAGPPLMTMHLVDDLSLQQLSDLIAYLQLISN